MLFVESCSNPNGVVFDFDTLRALKHSVPKLTVIVDNTWLTSAVFNPFTASDAVDFVVTSLTKYYGAGRSGIAGAVMSRSSDDHKRLLEYGKVKGLHVSPLYCEAQLAVQPGLLSRVAQSSATTQQLAVWLVQQGVEVSYPLLPQHPSHALACKYFARVPTADGAVRQLGPSVLTVTIPLDRSAALKWMRSSAFGCSTSFGCGDSRFDQWPSRKNKRMTTCRFAVGFEDTLEDIVGEWERLLARVNG